MYLHEERINQDSFPTITDFIKNALLYYSNHVSIFWHLQLEDIL